MPIQLHPEDKRNTILPIHRQNIWNYYIQGTTQYWTANEISFKNESYDYSHKLNDDERHIIDFINGFFAQSDQLIVDVIADDFKKELGKIPELKFWYGWKESSELVHVLTYNRQIVETVADSERRNAILNSVQTIPEVGNMLDWIQYNLCNPEKTYYHRLVASVCAEGILFSSQFAIIYWFQDRALMNGTAQANALIARDENLHAIGEIAILKETSIIDTGSKDKGRNLFISAVDQAKEFSRGMFRRDLVGMSHDLCCQYIEYVCDHYFEQLYGEKIYGTGNPFKFMAKISLPTLTNFFEKKATEYNTEADADGAHNLEETDEF